jgi:hypothetical protein
MGSCSTKDGANRKCSKFFNKPVQIHKNYPEYEDLTSDLNNLDLLDVCSSDDDVFDLYFNDINTFNNKYRIFGSNCTKRV